MQVTKPTVRKINSWKASVTIKDVNGRQLKAGTDYDKQLIYTYEGMEEGEFRQQVQWSM